MTEKKEKILQSALELFAKEGYTATSTSKVAKHAKVSEGLIFRHFGNKEGLLEAIIKEGEERAKILFAAIVFETDPNEVIAKLLDMIESLSKKKEDFEFWKLQYKIKWETEKYAEHKMEALHLSLSNAFKKLGYDSPELESTILLVTMDGLATRLCLQKNFEPQPIINFLRKKYNK
jgi:AcrR family transcriptional regulator